MITLIILAILVYIGVFIDLAIALLLVPTYLFAYFLWDALLYKRSTKKEAPQPFYQNPTIQRIVLFLLTASMFFVGKIIIGDYFVPYFIVMLVYSLISLVRRVQKRNKAAEPKEEPTIEQMTS
ncbi:hypothetical protein [Oceanobacillus halotolerans]|uniref:hypothetical protein n=1 Tax=Oceanobacillus halotolerans TaxID=2663380 RepID=UPI0013D99134|nr:hypothetical protein [Oceanobacillus halotolerans]